MTSEGRVDLDLLESLLSSKTRVVAFNHVSNALGTINPVRDIVRLVRDRTSAIIVCDGAQGVPHLRVGLRPARVSISTLSAATRCAGRWELAG